VILAVMDEVPDPEGVCDEVMLAVIEEVPVPEGV